MVRIQEDPSSSDEDDSRVAANNNASSSSSALTSPSSDKENARSKGKGSGGGGAVSKANAKGKGAVRGNGKGKGKGKEVVRRHGGGLAEIGEQNEILESEEEEEGSEEEGGEEEEEVGEEEEEEEEEDGEEQDGEGEEEEEEEEQKDTDMFDPDQDPEERRQVRMQYRELGRKLNDNKNEYLQPHSDGLLRTFEQAEQLFKKVKQTSDATIDSRILVQATDLALKKATNLTYGNSGATIDADEFVGQCIAFMRSSTRPPPANNNNNDDDDNAAADDAMDWAYLGRMAAFKGNKRPATTDFLLGPLSVTKKIRIMKARRQGLRRDNANLVRPVEVTQQQGAGEKAEANGSSAMSALVQKIYLDLKAWFRRNPRQAEKGLSLFRFVVNPDSFGQTVENMFYLSFLVKDGFIAIAYDEENGLPVIHCTDPASQEDHKEFDVSRSQVIFSITMWEWQEMKRIFDITESMIPTRAQEQALTSATGWYS